MSLAQKQHTFQSFVSFLLVKLSSKLTLNHDTAFSMVSSIFAKSGSMRKKKAGQRLPNWDIKFGKSYEDGTCLLGTYYLKCKKASWISRNESHTNISAKTGWNEIDRWTYRSG